MVDLEYADQVEYEAFFRGLSEETVKNISVQLQEPDRMLQLRLQAFSLFQNMEMPKYGPDLSSIDFDALVYYARPKHISQHPSSWNQVPENVKSIFQKLRIPEAEQQYLAGVGGQFDSTSIYHKLKEKRKQSWIIFEDLSEAIREYPDLVQKHFMKLVPSSDHKFAALHGAVWSGGTFVYVPKWVKISDPLQAYFRMNTYEGGQFEHTLIILEDNAEASYIEGCSAPKFDKRSLHAGCVEIYVGNNAKMRYSSVENRSLNTFNLNTKRALVGERGIMEWIWGNLGSGATMLYPCSILKGDYAKSDNLSVVVASSHQHQDVGAKVIHIGNYTSSNIVSKSISKSGGINTYRGTVVIKKDAKGVIHSTQCDALLLDGDSVSNTIPVIRGETDDATISHEASAGNIDEEILFYLMSRGIRLEKAKSMVVNGFISEVVKQLPLEYAGELNHLMELEMEGSIG